MEWQDVAAAVGMERYQLACEWAWRTGFTVEDPRATPWPSELNVVPHEAADLWGAVDVPLLERLRVALEIYRQMPCYGFLMYIKDEFNGFGPPERELLWSEFRSLLDEGEGREPLVEPVAYLLLVDFFEDPSTVEEAWRELAIRSPDSDLRLHRVLEVSAPVPYSLKSPLFEDLAAHTRWHESIAKGLIDSATSVYGDLDVSKARKLLLRLVVPPDLPGLDQLRKRLAAPA